MNMEDIIIKKRDGGALTQSEIRYFVKGYVAGEIPDYQASALLMNDEDKKEMRGREEEVMGNSDRSAGCIQFQMQD